MIRRLLNNVIETTYLQGENVYYQNIFASSETKQFAWLTRFAPCFPIKSSNISILNDPHQFYDILLQLSQCARTRITFASLYFGSGTLEKNLVENVLKNTNFQNGSLEVNVLLDYTRGSRFSDNSRTTLLPLLNKNNKKCQISLYHTPVLRGVLKKIVPNKWNELFGLQHMKLYIFDDTLVISGANLSNDYFTNRQDRYFLIKDKKLCDFYSGLVSKIQMFSLVIDKKNNVNLNKNWDIWPYKGKKIILLLTLEI
ncbi:hypothetical protein WA026_001439 [Henosepilachna vigintioctopunctata]|uniref:CDP-diacylglycerol--glycerol-3-phosphate 3-phosphatidyltransferase n=1 Tax=Henosepilachna vigintioctopunctata TaxID=420089 RepID=A0AAW1UTG5_9CUCU